ncbi:P44/Msp2 family outer membrane protein [Wolbachia endosymbiont (group E) of Neria commutata]|uniref:P44/Msp2 family outer membrane protein n=1 Tax=Wolbachia endosymbiont (group E) of Neria commutata TaxID=3066149 RepID=UPI00313336EE
MLYKKPLLKTAVVTLLLTFISNSSFAYTEYGFLDSKHKDEDYSYSTEEKPSNVYMSFNYSKANPGISSFSARENSIQKVEISNNFDYKSGFAGNASIGYRVGDMRVELANPRLSLIDSDLSSHLYPGDGYTRVDVVGDNGNVVENLYKGNVSTLQHDGIEKHIRKEGNPKRYSEPLLSMRKIENNSFKKKAAMVNLYYDISNHSDFTPYLSIGGSIANISLSGISQIKPAIQGKLGLNYNINNKIQLSAGYRYLTALGQYDFQEVKLNEVPTLKYTVRENSHDQDGRSSKIVKEIVMPGSTTATVESNFANHALEVGLTFNF